MLGITDVGARSSDRLTYHPACHGLRGLGVVRQPLALLEKVEGPALCPLPDAETCCGFGGLFAVKLSEVSGSLLDRKIASIEASGADTLVATDVSCLMHIAGGLHRKGSPMKVKHLAEVLAGEPDPHGDTSPATFYERVDKAISSPALQAAVRNATFRMSSGREAAVAAFPEMDVVRDHARAIRAHTIARLDHYLREFEASVQRRGGHVHWAATSEEAVAIVVDIARQHGVKAVVKGKSMVSEEIELNPGLARAGVQVLETDLGEYIVQLDDDHPSHIVMPIIHKSRQDVARLFRAKLQATDDEVADAPRMAALARRVLRKGFLQADMGISGGNFGVAATGSVCITTNEGNGRLTTSLPRVHVALMGIERIVPTLDDLGVMLQVLGRSATGQKLTVYSNVMSGPRRHGDDGTAGESDGPDHFHVVLVDNGRSKLVGSELAEILYCIRCGACLNSCPVYQQWAGMRTAASIPARLARC